MHRDDWSSVFANQDRILEPLENEMLQRFVLPMPYRHSEDLDFFFSTLKTNKELENIKNKIVELITNLDGAKLDREPIWRKEEKCFLLLMIMMKLLK